MKASQVGLSQEAIHDEHKFLTENFVSGSWLLRLESTSKKVKSALEDEHKTAAVLYTGSKWCYTPHVSSSNVHTHLAVVPKEVNWRRVQEIFDAYGLQVTMSPDMMTQTYWEHCALEGNLM